MSAADPERSAADDRSGLGRQSMSVREGVGRLRVRHPGVVLWFGEATRRWWAPAGGRLVEAGDADELDVAVGWSRPHVSGAA